MSKKLFLVVLGFIFLFSFNVAQASLVINEIMYDLEGTDTDREWVEIYNPDNVSVDITGDWRFNDGSSHWMNNKDSFSIPAHGYIILASDKDTFLSEHNNFSGTVIDTTINLNNTGGTIKILDANSVALDTKTYTSSDGANGDGKSLQRISNSWTAEIPTPALVNSNNIENNSGGETNSSSNSSGASSLQNTNQKTKVIENPKIRTKITAKTFAFTNIPVVFSANTIGYNNESLFYGKYFWNFGDGDFKEINAKDITKFSHIFFYEGEYTVTLEYYQNYYSEVPDAIDEITIKVIKPDILISNVGDEKDFFIEIFNDSSYDADISKWVLLSNQKSFTLPKNTILESKKKMILSPHITNMTFLDKDNLKLLNSQWEIVSDYSISLKPIEIIKKSNISPKIPVQESIDNSFSNLEIDENNEEEILSENLEANLLKSNINNTGNNLIYWFGLFAFLGISTSASYFIRNRNRKTVVGQKGDDFEILDE